jgi:mannose-6-phosphate isomerase-like protein (cupin superfamily)
MKKTEIALAALGLALLPSCAHAQSDAKATPQANILPAQTDAVFITQGDFEKVLAARAGGTGMGALGAVRAGDDRINVDVLRRDSPDEGPVLHEKVTEIYYVLDGGGDFATGGTLVDPKAMTKNQASIGPSLKGARVDGGTSRHVVAGDVVMIPPNVVHGFTKLDGHVTYMVVRVNPGYEKAK